MIPVVTSSGYLADERLLLPEDAVCFCFFVFHLLISDLVLRWFIMKGLIMLTNLLPILWNFTFIYIWSEILPFWFWSDNPCFHIFLLDMYANTYTPLHMCMWTWVHYEWKKNQCWKIWLSVRDFFFCLLFTFVVYNFTPVLLADLLRVNREWLEAWLILGKKWRSFCFL